MNWERKNGEKSFEKVDLKLKLSDKMIVDTKSTSFVKPFMCKCTHDFEQNNITFHNSLDINWCFYQIFIIWSEIFKEITCRMK